jgi:hypothetical protein
MTPFPSFVLLTSNAHCVVSKEIAELSATDIFTYIVNTGAVWNISVYITIKEDVCYF